MSDDKLIKSPLFKYIRYYNDNDLRINTTDILHTMHIL